MTDAEICDKCGRLIKDNNVGIELEVHDIGDDYRGGPRKYDLHESCWLKIKKQFKKQ
jgi:hypothetical protein